MRFDVRGSPNVALTALGKKASGRAEVMALKMAGPASFCTVVTMILFETLGKLSVRSIAEVIREPSLTGRKGSN